MNSPAPVATFVIGAMLSASVLCGSFDPASAGQIAVSSNATAEAVALPPATNQPASEPHGRAYLFRGALGPIFSRGMDRLTEKIEHAGITANVYEFTICRLVADSAVREYRRDPAPIILIGHSMGGYCALKFAEVLQAENISVSLIVTVDPAHVTPSVPLNVERYINIFLSKSVLGGGDVKPAQGYQGDAHQYRQDGPDPPANRQQDCRAWHDPGKSGRRGRAGSLRRSSQHRHRAVGQRYSGSRTSRRYATEARDTSSSAALVAYPDQPGVRQCATGAGSTRHCSTPSCAVR
jgi:hypothetical protein